VIEKRAAHPGRHHAIELLRAPGVRVDWSGEHAVEVDAGRLRESRPDAALAAEIRASSSSRRLLARTGLAVLPRPGGDKIGRRRLDTHLLALQPARAGSPSTTPTINLELSGRFRGAEVFPRRRQCHGDGDRGDGGRDGRGAHAAAERGLGADVQGLCHALNAMEHGSPGSAANVLEIDGVGELHPARHRVGPGPHRGRILSPPSPR